MDGDKDGRISFRDFEFMMKYDEDDDLWVSVMISRHPLIIILFYMIVSIILLQNGKINKTSTNICHAFLLYSLFSFLFCKCKQNLCSQ